MAGLANSDGCRPSQPKLLLSQSLPPTLQPSEFVAFVVKRYRDFVSYLEFPPMHLANNFGWPVIRSQWAASANGPSYSPQQDLWASPIVAAARRGLSLRPAPNSSEAAPHAATSDRSLAGSVLSIGVRGL